MPKKVGLVRAPSCSRAPMPKNRTGALRVYALCALTRLCYKVVDEVGFLLRFWLFYVFGERCEGGKLVGNNLV